MQSYDGSLYFFEAESLAFTRYLPNFLVPGPLAYVEACDTFVTCTAAMEVGACKRSKEEPVHLSMPEFTQVQTLAAALLGYWLP